MVELVQGSLSKAMETHTKWMVANDKAPYNKTLVLYSNLLSPGFKSGSILGMSQQQSHKPGAPNSNPMALGARSGAMAGKPRTPQNNPKS